MATPCSKVFKAFLSLITEDFYAEIETIDVSSTEAYNKKQYLIDVMMDDLMGLLEGACGSSSFKYPRVSLEIDDDHFVEDLGADEIRILAYIMRRDWCSRWVYNCELARQQYGDRDFSFSSQGNHLKALIQMKRLAEEDVKRAQNDYSRSIGHKPNFGGLAGSE